MDKLVKGYLRDIGTLPSEDSAKLQIYQGAVDINGRTYRDNSLVTTKIGTTEYQAQAYWNVSGNAVIQIRKRITTSAPFDSWISHIYDGTKGLPVILISDPGNDHRTLNIAFDKNGYLHASYDHHNDNLKYRKSIHPVTTFNGELSLENQPFTQRTIISYVKFFNSPNGKLFVMFRRRGALAGNIYLNEYNELTELWNPSTGTAASGLILDGENIQGAYSYSSGFDANFGDGGFMHFAWHWKVHPGYNTNIGYVKWDGTTFYKSNGTVQTMPITISRQEIADPVPIGQGLGAQNSIKPDNNGNPHIVYVRHDSAGWAQIYHTWHNGTIWQTPRALTSNTTIKSGDPENEFWRAPDIAIKPSNGHAYIIWNLLNTVGLWMFESKDYITWKLTQIDTAPTGLWSPCYDPWQWENNEVLYLPQQSPLSFKIITLSPVSDTVKPNSYNITIEGTKSLVCNGNNTGTITATIAGGREPFAYLWSSGQTSATISGLSAGTYSVTITDADLLSTTASFTISQPTIISASFTTTTPNCRGNVNGAIIINGTGGTPGYRYSIDGTNYQSKPIFENLAAGSYNVQIRDTLNCAGSINIFVNQSTTGVTFNTSVI